MAKTTKEKEETTKENQVESTTEILVENEGKVGGILKQARLKSGKSIVDVADCLRIRKVYLEAIESSSYDHLPEMPYAVGFIRSYAEYVGLDSAQMARMYKSEADARFNKNSKMYVLEPQTEATVPSKKYLLISLLAIIAIYFSWYLYNNANNEAVVVEDEVASEAANTSSDQYPLIVEDFAPLDDTAAAENNGVIDAAPIEQVSAEQVVVSEASYPETPAAPAVEAAPAPAPVAVPAAVSATGKSNIVLKIKKETWIEVKNKDKLFISKVLNSGDEYVIPEGEGMILSVGRFDGVDVLVDGKKVDIINPNKKTNIELKKAIESANH